MRRPATTITHVETWRGNASPLRSPRSCASAVCRGGFQTRPYTILVRSLDAGALNFNGAVTNTGTVKADGGNVTIAGALSDGGNASISGAAIGGLRKLRRRDVDVLVGALGDPIEQEICPKCGSAKHYATKKAGVYRCGSATCRKDFTVMTGTVMERSHAKRTQWAAAFHLGASSKKGFSAHQFHRELGCQYNTAWFLHHRVMEAMRRGGLDLPPMGGEGKVVDADETYYGDIPEAKLPKFKTTGRPFKGRTGPGHTIVPRLGTTTRTAPLRQ
jgi:transposase-like protein